MGLKSEIMRYSVIIKTLYVNYDSAEPNFHTSILRVFYFFWWAINNWGVDVEVEMPAEQSEQRPRAQEQTSPH